MFKMLFGISTVILHQRIKAVINGFLYLHLWHSKSQPSVAYKSVTYKNKRACMDLPERSESRNSKYGFHIWQTPSEIWTEAIGGSRGDVNWFQKVGSPARQ